MTLEELRDIVNAKTKCNFTIKGSAMYYSPFNGTDIMARFLYHGFAYSYIDSRYGHRGGRGPLDTVEDLTSMLNLIIEDMKLSSERKENKK